MWQLIYDDLIVHRVRIKSVAIKRVVVASENRFSLHCFGTLAVFVGVCSWRVRGRRTFEVPGSTRQWLMSIYGDECVRVCVCARALTCFESSSNPVNEIPRRNEFAGCITMSDALTILLFLRDSFVRWGPLFRIPISFCIGLPRISDGSMGFRAFWFAIRFPSSLVPY